MPVDTTLERPLPNNLDAERSVLGAILLDNNALNPAIEHLRPEDFFLDQHRRGVGVGLLPIKDIVRDNFERLERIFREGKSITGIPTGYVELDKLTSGLQPSELLILAARPSQGKTALALNLMENIAIRGGHPVAMFSLEKSKESLLPRLVAAGAPSRARTIRTGHLGK